MTLAELNQQLSEVQASLQYWQNQQAEALDLVRRAQAQAAAAQRQIDVHQGHVERIEMWLKRLQAEHPTEEPSTNDKQSPIDAGLTEA